MYSLFQTYCEENTIPQIKYWQYYDVFRGMDIKFHIPRKDMCDVCYRYGHAIPEDKLLIEEDYQSHVSRKRDARRFHDTSKEAALRGEAIFIEFDMEAVRYCPSVRAKAIFYKRRLTVYNCTIFDEATRNASNYMWHEGFAGRGSNEVASCLFDYLKIAQNGKPVIMMSDTCGGQNRNINVSAFLLYCVQTLDIPVIDHCFFEPGHSMMEVDSVHAQIGKSTKRVEIMDPNGWFTAVDMAGKKYAVIEMDQFYDSKDLKAKLITNNKIGCDQTTINWLKITWLQYRKDDPAHIYYKYEKGEDFRMFKVKRRSIIRLQKITLPELHTLPNGRKISTDKARDLKDLCEKGIIPNRCHEFYTNLRT